MKLSSTTFRELSKKYRSILKKCAFLNAIIIIGISINTNAKADAFIGTPNSTNTENSITFSLAGSQTDPLSYTSISATGYNNNVEGSINLSLNYVNVENAPAPAYDASVIGNLYNAGISLPSGLNSAFVQEDVNITVSNSTIGNSSLSTDKGRIIGNEFQGNNSTFATFTNEIGTKGKTTINISDSTVSKTIRGANINGASTWTTNLNNFKIGDIELNIADTEVGEEILGVGAYVSANNVTINVKGNTSVGYIPGTQTSSGDGEGIQAGASRTGGIISGNTLINLDTNGSSNTIKVDQAINSGSRSDADENSVQGNATINILGGGTIEAGKLYLIKFKENRH